MAEIEWRADQPPTPEPRALSKHPARSEGARAGSGLLVLVQREAWQAIDSHLASDLMHEQGGVLAGRPYVDPESGQVFVEVGAVAPALGAEGSPVHLQLTAEAWDYMAALLAAEHPDLIVVGWYHSHPGLGVFMSGTDRATQRAFYTQPWHLALVMDPISGDEAWFAGPHCDAVPAANVVRFGRHAVASPGTGRAAAPPAPERRIEPAQPQPASLSLPVYRERLNGRTGVAVALLLVAGYWLWRLAVRRR